MSREANKVADTGPQYRGVCKSGRRVQIGGGKVEPMDVSVQQDALREEELAALSSAGVCCAVEIAFKQNCTVCLAHPRPLLLVSMEP